VEKVQALRLRKGERERHPPNDRKSSTKTSDKHTSATGGERKRRTEKKEGSHGNQPFVKKGGHSLSQKVNRKRKWGERLEAGYLLK